MEYSQRTEQDLLALREDLAKQRSELDKRIQAIEMILPEFSRRVASIKLPQFVPGSYPKSTSVEPVIILDASMLRGMKQYPALKAIAKAHDGFLRTLEAKDLMVKAGVMKDSKNAYKMVYNLIKNSDEFRPTGKRGEYYLTEKQPSLQ